VPDEFNELLEFRKAINDTEKELNGPTVVHCSAGVGRTGTYIAIDRAMNQAFDTGVKRDWYTHINIYQIVTDMRKSRNFMVQHADQYKFIYGCVLEGLNKDTVSYTDMTQYVGTSGPSGPLVKLLMSNICLWVKANSTDAVKETETMSGWWMMLNSSGESYYVNYQMQVSTYDYPSSCAAAPQHPCPLQLTEEEQRIFTSRMHPNGRFYYINRDENTSSSTDPRTGKESVDPLKAKESVDPLKAKKKKTKKKEKIAAETTEVVGMEQVATAEPTVAGTEAHGV
jgi:hypothetical protein